MEGWLHFDVAYFQQFQKPKKPSKKEKKTLVLKETKATENITRKGTDWRKFSTDSSWERIRGSSKLVTMLRLSDVPNSSECGLTFRWWTDRFFGLKTGLETGLHLGDCTKLLQKISKTSEVYQKDVCYSIILLELLQDIESSYHLSLLNLEILNFDKPNASNA